MYTRKDFSPKRSYTNKAFFTLDIAPMPHNGRLVFNTCWLKPKLPYVHKERFQPQEELYKALFTLDTAPMQHNGRLVFNTCRLKPKLPYIHKERFQPQEELYKALFTLDMALTQQNGRLVFNTCWLKPKLPCVHKERFQSQEEPYKQSDIHLRNGHHHPHGLLRVEGQQSCNQLLSTHGHASLFSLTVISQTIITIDIHKYKVTSLFITNA